MRYVRSSTATWTTTGSICGNCYPSVSFNMEPDAFFGESPNSPTSNRPGAQCSTPEPKPVTVPWTVTPNDDDTERSPSKTWLARSRWCARFLTSRLKSRWFSTVEDKLTLKDDHALEETLDHEAERAFFH